MGLLRLVSETMRWEVELEPQARVAVARVGHDLRGVPRDLAVPRRRRLRRERAVTKSRVLELTLVEAPLLWLTI